MQLMTKFHNVSTTASYRWSTAAYQTSQHRLFCLRRSGNRLGHLGFCWGAYGIHHGSPSNSTLELILASLKIMFLLRSLSRTLHFQD